MASPTERSIVDILQDIVGDIQGLIHTEVLLAKSEVREEVRKTASAGKVLAVGLVSGVLAVLFLCLGVAWALALFIPLWLGLFAVAGVLLVIGAIAIQAGRARFAEVDMTPHRAIAQITENLK